MLLTTVFPASGQSVVATRSVPAGMIRPTIRRATPNFSRVSALISFSFGFPWQRDHAAPERGRTGRFVLKRGSHPSSMCRALAKKLLRRGLEQEFAHAMDLAVALQDETAAMECAERRAMPDRQDCRAFEPYVEKAIEHGFRRLIERRSRLVEEKVIRRMQNGAGNAEALLLAE